MGRKVVGNDMQFIEGDLYYGQVSIQQQAQRPPIQQQPPASQPPMLPPGTQVTRPIAPAIQPGLQTTTQPGTQRMVFTPAPGIAPPPGVVTTRPPITPVRPSAVYTMRTYTSATGWRTNKFPPNTPKEKALEIFNMGKKQPHPADTYVELLDEYGVVIDSFGIYPSTQVPTTAYTLKAYTVKDGWIEQTVYNKTEALAIINKARQRADNNLVYMEVRENGILIDSVGTMPGTVTPPPPPEIPPTIIQAPPPTPGGRLPVAPGTSTDDLVNELLAPDDTVEDNQSTQEQAPPITYTPPPGAPNPFDDFIAWLESILHIKIRSQTASGFRAPRPRGVLPKRAKALRPERDDDSLPPLEEYEYEDLSDDYIEPELYVDDSMSDYQEAVRQETDSGEPDVDYSLYGIVSNEQRPEPRYERMKMIRRKGE